MSKHQENSDRMTIEDASRRDLLKGAASAAVAGAALLAMDVRAATEGSAKRQLPAKWDETYDVVVIGSGFAGLAAAAEAAALGNKVVVLEKMPTYGGNSIINGGEYASSDSQLHLRQKLGLGDDSISLHAADTLKGGDKYGFPELVQVMAEGAQPALDWMIKDGGLKLRPILNRTGGHTAYRTHTCEEGVGRGYTEALRKIATERGATMVLNSPISWIWRKDADSPVLGVEVMRRKKAVNIRAVKAIVLASGGFGADVKFRTQHNPRLTGDYNCTNHKGATGETITFAQAIGADTLQMNFIQLYPFAEPETGLLDAAAVYPFRGPGYGIVYVTKQGKRFVNENERRDVVSEAEIATGLKPTFSIFCEAMIPKMGTKPEVEAYLAKGRFVQASSLRELGTKLGVDPTALEETIAKHNKYLADGKDPDFNRQYTKAMLPIAEGPFYGIAQWPAVHHTMGGLRINAKAQVIDIWGKPIPRFYAAGEITGGVHGSNRLGSNAIPDAVSFGRVAGVNAGKEPLES
jgi:fumarate reductase flavoprotein subunit